MRNKSLTNLFGHLQLVYTYRLDFPNELMWTWVNRNRYSRSHLDTAFGRPIVRNGVSCLRFKVVCYMYHKFAHCVRWSMNKAPRAKHELYFVKAWARTLRQEQTKPVRWVKLTEAIRRNKATVRFLAKLWWAHDKWVQTDVCIFPNCVRSPIFQWWWWNFPSSLSDQLCLMTRIAEFC